MTDLSCVPNLLHMSMHRTSSYIKHDIEVHGAVLVESNTSKGTCLKLERCSTHIRIGTGYWAYTLTRPKINWLHIYPLAHFLSLLPTYRACDIYRNDRYVWVHPSWCVERPKERAWKYLQRKKRMCCRTEVQRRLGACPHSPWLRVCPQHRIGPASPSQTSLSRAFEVSKGKLLWLARHLQE